MDGKNPPTTSVVVDLEKALAYDVAPGPAGKVILILHTQGGTPAVAKHPGSESASFGSGNSESFIADQGSFEGS